VAERIVTAPDGRTWRVRRRWLPRHARWLGVGFARARRPKPAGGAFDGPDWLRGPDVVSPTSPLSR
jgi:hypothetical protein